MEICDETTLIPVRDIERKMIPVICPWCNKLKSVMEWEVEKGRKIEPTHGICSSCHDFLLRDMAFENKGLEHRE